MHPHVLQGAEYFGSVPVLYSIGNFAFASKRPAARASLFVRLLFGPEKLEGVEFIPVEISPRGEPMVAAGARGVEILGHLDGFCRKFNAKITNRRLTRAQVRERLILDLEKGAKPRGSRGTGSRGKLLSGSVTSPKK
jgi:poly-gamma-glutamate capsule biosynthesis protein CapA/YwtB (metallophosphatase superfamily)